MKPFARQPLFFLQLRASSSSASSRGPCRPVERAVGSSQSGTSYHSWPCPDPTAPAIIRDGAPPGAFPPFVDDDLRAPAPPRWPRPASRHRKRPTSGRGDTALSNLRGSASKAAGPQGLLRSLQPGLVFTSSLTSRAASLTKQASSVALQWISLFHSPRLTRRRSAQSLLEVAGGEGLIPGLARLLDNLARRRRRRHRFFHWFLRFKAKVLSLRYLNHIIVRSFAQDRTADPARATTRVAAREVVEQSLRQTRSSLAAAAPPATPSRKNASTCETDSNMRLAVHLPRPAQPEG